MVGKALIVLIACLSVCCTGSAGVSRSHLSAQADHVALPAGVYCVRVPDGQRGWIRLFAAGRETYRAVDRQGVKLNLPAYAEADVAKDVDIRAGECGRGLSGVGR